ncbi:MAG TPA: adenylate/guanylate cyclase domain-containing protein [Candidatus Limnocylindrales bacterium]|nr:adenylate/guanylate cyclase domain-containing protein [Candidatus Limnocylindrales bacterium]
MASESVFACGSCGTENPSGRKFCGECGSPLPPTCPACGAQAEAGQKFCGQCGSTLGDGPRASPAIASGQVVAPGSTSAPSAPPVSGAAPPARPGGEGATRAPGAALTSGQGPIAERRLVSVLFADLVGFTTLADGRDAEETRELLSRYFESAQDIVGRYGGTVEKFIGDAVMAVWGTPTAHEDDAERAVRAALDLIDAVRRLSPGLQARAGIRTGEAAVTLGATGQGMVAGDLVNTASRLQSVAAPGTVLVDQVTQLAAARAVAFEPAGAQELKGKEEPIVAFRALRVVAERGGRGRSDRIEPPFVGRDIELRLLKDFFHATGRERRPRLVTIIGQAGIGKSRLAWELQKYVDGIVEQVVSNTGRSPAYGEGVTFWALGEIVRQRTGLAEGDDEATTRAKIAETLDQRVPDPGERQTIEPALLALLGLEPAPAGGRDELFAAWRLFLERGAAGRTMILTFEDLQWADAGLLDFIDHLLEWSRGVPIFVIALSRPELLERRPDWGAGRRNSVTLSLEPLPDEAMRELLAGLAPGLPERAVARIIERADGIPLYAVETVRMLVADGRLVEDEVGYRPSGDLSDLAVPETLQALIAARLDGLDPLDRSLLQDAAVLGQSFPSEALSEVSGRPEDELRVRLDRLVARELLTVETDSSSSERGQYAFVQALIREVAYGTLARRDRRMKHLAAARYFESLGDDELAGALAAHYLAAHRESPQGPEADALAVQARLALRGAAERAAALGSHAQAMIFLEQALDVTTDPTDTAELLLAAGNAALTAGRNEHAETLLRRAVEAARELEDPPATSRAAASLASLLTSLARPDESVRLLEPLAIGGEALGPADLLVRSQLARAYFFADDSEAAIRVADQILPAAEHAGDFEIVAETLITKGLALGMLARLQEALALIAGGRRLAEQQGLTATMLRGYINESSLMGGIDPRQALALGRAGLEEARRLGQRHMGATLLMNSTESAEETGDWAWAIAALDADADDFEGTDRANVLTNLVRYMALRGEPTDEVEAEVGKLVAGLNDMQTTQTIESMRGLRSLATGDLHQAFESWFHAAQASAYQPGHFLNAARAALWARNPDGAREALERFDASGSHGQGFHAYRRTVLAGLAALDGRRDEALAAYRDALREWRDLGATFNQALAALDMIQLLPASAPDLPAVAAAARDIFVQLEARPFIERLDAAMAVREANDALPAPATASAQDSSGASLETSPRTVSA